MNPRDIPPSLRWGFLSRWIVQEPKRIAWYYAALLLTLLVLFIALAVLDEWLAAAIAALGIVVFATEGFVYVPRARTKRDLG